MIHHNAFLDNNETAICQVYDDSSYTLWYDGVDKGNYYSDWISGPYLIVGEAGNSDPYPLASNPL